MLDKPDNKKENFFIKVFALILVIIVVLGGIYFLFFIDATDAMEDNGSVLATDYENITAAAAYEIYKDYNNSKSEGNNLTIIDARVLDISCGSCLLSAYRRGHLPGAILDKELNPKEYYNKTTDIMVYSQDGSNKRAIEFCKSLVGHIYGDIYYLDGGYLAWKDAGY